MAWLQQGLADGTLPVNVAGALVHFVPEGMLLVSPRIFREFATRFGDDSNGPAPLPATRISANRSSASSCAQAGIGGPGRASIC